MPPSQGREPKPETDRTEITSEQVVQELVADPDSPWQEYRGRGPITKNQVAALLRDYDIRPAVVHPTKRADFSRHGYRAAQFEDAFARFLPHEPNIRTLKRGGKSSRRSISLPRRNAKRRAAVLPNFARVSGATTRS